MTHLPNTILSSHQHRDFLKQEALAQLEFFAASHCPSGGFYSLDYDGSAIPDTPQELHATTRMVHCSSLASIAGWARGEAMIDHGIKFLLEHHKDSTHGGYVWSVDHGVAQDDKKLAYGHVFVLLAAASATAAGHPDAPKLLEDIDHVLDHRFWDEDRGLFKEEWSRDWQPISRYRGMNANMHGLEALMSAYEATGRAKYLERSGRIIDFFVGQIAPAENWRIPEHYDETWQFDRAYEGNPMFRPRGTTPGHSLEISRLLLQYYELSGGVRPDLIESAKQLADTALRDAWDNDAGGIYYTLNFDGSPDRRDLYWWPVTEAIGAMAAFLKLEPSAEYSGWYQKLWDVAGRLFIDHERGGWYPEVYAEGQVASQQFAGKPDLYHSLQAALLPLTPSVSNAYRDLNEVLSQSQPDRSSI